jgi:high-affinity Fe2+/Pb2+ permease
MGVESAASSSSNSWSQNDEDDNSSKNNSSIVVLNVYDLTPINNYMYWFGFGIFHSGIEGTFPVFLSLLQQLVDLICVKLFLFLLLFGISRCETV